MANDPYAMRVKEVMVKGVVSVGPKDSLDDALALLIENRVSGLPVVDSRRRCVGVLSTTDLLGPASELGERPRGIGRNDESMKAWLLETADRNDLSKRRVEEVMTPDVVAIGPESSLAQAAREMVRSRVHRLAVLDDEKRLLGIVSTMDVLDAFAAGAPQ